MGECILGLVLGWGAVLGLRVCWDSDVVAGEIVQACVGGVSRCVDGMVGGV